MKPTTIGGVWRELLFESYGDGIASSCLHSFDPYTGCTSMHDPAMDLSIAPTTFLQMLTVASPAVKQEVDRRLALRAEVCRNLLAHGELDMLESLRRCEKNAIWIVMLLSGMGATVGWFAHSSLVGLCAAMMGAAIGAWTAGVMVDGVHALGQLACQNRDASPQDVHQPPA